jgi:hypothetical protein
MDRTNKTPPIVVNPDEFGRPLTIFGVGDNIWSIAKTDKQQFKERMEGYVALCMPGYRIVKLIYPNVLLQEERQPKG